MEKKENNPIVNLLKKLGNFLKTDLLSTLKNFSWLTGSQSVVILSSFFLSIAFANLLSPETYGIYRYLLSIASIVAISSLGGMNISLTTAIANGKDGDFKNITKIKLLAGLIGTLAGLLLASYYIWQQNPTLGYSLIIVSILAPIVDSLLIYNSILQGKNDFKRFSQYAATSQIIFAFSMFLTILLSDNIHSIIFIYFASLFTGRFIAFKLTQSKHHLNQSKDPGVANRGFHLSLNSVITTVAANIDKLIVFTYLGTVELAIYTIATTPVDQVRGLFKNLSTLILPKYASQEIAVIKSNIHRKVFILTIVCLITTLIYILLAPIVFPIIFPKYPSSISFSIINAFSILAIPALITSTFLQAKSDNSIYYKYNTLSSIIQIAFLFVGAYYFKLIGVVVAKTLGQLSLFAISIYYSRKIS